MTFEGHICGQENGVGDDGLGTRLTRQQIHVKFIPSGTVEYGQLNMALYSTVALYTSSMEQIYSCGIKSYYQLMPKHTSFEHIVN